MQIFRKKFYELYLNFGYCTAMTYTADMRNVMISKKQLVFVFCSKIRIDDFMKMLNNRNTVELLVKEFVKGNTAI